MRDKLPDGLSANLMRSTVNLRIDLSVCESVSATGDYDSRQIPTTRLINTVSRFNWKPFSLTWWGAGGWTKKKRKRKKKISDHIKEVWSL